MKLISIVIPTLNEETGIRKTISQIPVSELTRDGYDVEILVIDGNSKDATREVAAQLGARVINEKRKGYGRAYKTGLVEAKGDTIVTLDADGTYPANLIPKYLEKFNASNVDFMTVNRFSKMEKGAMSFSHKIGNAILSATMRILYSVDVRDSQSGMWIMKKDFVNKIRLNSDDMAMSEEIKIIAFRFFRAIEVDGSYYARTGVAKLNTLRHGWHNLKYLFEFRKLLGYSVIPYSRKLEKQVEEVSK